MGHGRLRLSSPQPRSCWLWGQERRPGPQHPPEREAGQAHGGTVCSQQRAPWAHTTQSASSAECSAPCTGPCDSSHAAAQARVSLTCESCLTSGSVTHTQLHLPQPFPGFALGSLGDLSFQGYWGSCGSGIPKPSPEGTVPPRGHCTGGSFSMSTGQAGGCLSLRPHGDHVQGLSAARRVTGLSRGQAPGTQDRACVPMARRL